MCESVPSASDDSSESSLWDVVEMVVAKLVKLLWLLVTKVVPVALALAIWWCSGTPLRPSVQRRYARRVHVAGRLAITAVAGAALWWGPVAVGIAVGAAAGAVGTAAGVTRAVQASRRRVRVQVGAPVRPAQIRR